MDLHSRVHATNARINAAYEVQKTMLVGHNVLAKEGKVFAATPGTTGPYTWKAGVTPFSFAPAEVVKNYLGFKPSSRDMTKAYEMTTLSLPAVKAYAAPHHHHPAAVRGGSHMAHYPATGDDNLILHLDSKALKGIQGYTPSARDRLAADRLVFGPTGHGTPSSSFGSEASTLPESFDWRDHTTISPVRNQGQCGSCWAVSAAGAATDRQTIACMRATKKSGQACMTPYAAQTMVSCAMEPSGQPFGCCGSDLVTPMEYIRDKGIPPKSYVTYTAHAGESSAQCHKVQACPAVLEEAKGASLLHSKPLPQGDATDPFRIPSNGGSIVEAMKREIMTNGPITAGMTVFLDLMCHYKEGVYHPLTSEQLGRTNTEMGGHALEIIGWGKDPIGGNYWLVKNSWGSDWGMGGYFKMRMYDGTHPGTIVTITGDVAGAGQPVMTFEASAHAALFPYQAATHQSGPSPSGPTPSGPTPPLGPTPPGNLPIPPFSPDPIFGPSNPLGPLNPL